MPNTSFVALDVETANVTVDSICQIGLVRFENGVIVDTFETLIDPEEDFEVKNTKIHNIHAADVVGSPKFSDVYPQLSQWLSNQIIVHYGKFDYSALKNASMKYALPAIPSMWVDAHRIAMSYFSGFVSLNEVADHFGIKFTHHNALQDATAAGLAALHLSKDLNTPLSTWVQRFGNPLTITSQEAAEFVNVRRSNFVAKVARPGCVDGPLNGQVIVFTGNLTLSRSEAAQRAAAAGCTVEDGVNKKTTLLVVGDRDLKFISSGDKSTKHRRAEDLIAKGQPIRILGETEFIKLLDC